MNTLQTHHPLIRIFVMKQAQRLDSLALFDGIHGVEEHMNRRWSVSGGSLQANVWVCSSKTPYFHIIILSNAPARPIHIIQTVSPPQSRCFCICAILFKICLEN